jgi:chlorobactene glucosyltransferase
MVRGDWSTDMPAGGILKFLPYLFAAGSVYFFILALSNIAWLWASRRRPSAKHGPLVSVLIPARNEEGNIGRCLDSLLRQSYENYEVLVLDDCSSDRTWAIIDGYAQRNPGRVRAFRGRPLPPAGWNGKPHALHQLAGQARGECLMFTDADTVHGPDSIAWAVTSLERHRVGFLSGYVRQDLRSFGEALLIPNMYLMTAVVMPIWLIPVTRGPVFSFAIGQLVVMRRAAYEAAGGYAAVSGQINDDISIARAVRRAGFRTVFLDAGQHVRCRMYDGFRASFYGLTKNISEFLNRNIASLLGVTLAVALLFLMPYALAVPYLVKGWAQASLVAGSVLLFQLTWCAVLYDRRLRWWVPFLYPATLAFVVVMMWLGYARLSRGTGLSWKGRVVR